MTRNSMTKSHLFFSLSYSLSEYDIATPMAENYCALRAANNNALGTNTVINFAPSLLFIPPPPPPFCIPSIAPHSKDLKRLCREFQFNQIKKRNCENVRKARVSSLAEWVRKRREHQSHRWMSLRQHSLVNVLDEQYKRIMTSHVVTPPPFLQRIFDGHSFENINWPLSHAKFVWLSNIPTCPTSSSSTLSKLFINILTNMHNYWDNTSQMSFKKTDP